MKAAIGKKAKERVGKWAVVRREGQQPYLCNLLATERNPQFFTVLGIINLDPVALLLFMVLAQKRTLKPAHIILLAMHQDHHLGAHLFDEARVLAIVYVRCKRELLDAHPPGNHDL